MRGIALQPLLSLLTGVELVWALIWGGLGILSLALIALLVTRWGQYKPLRKCIALSVWTHFLLAMYALTIDIVPRAGHPRGGDVRVAISDAPVMDEVDEPTQPADQNHRPWEQFSESSPGEMLPAQPPRPAETAADAPPMSPTIQELLPTVLPVSPRVAAEIAVAEPKFSESPATRTPARDVESADAPHSLIGELPQPTSAASPSPRAPVLPRELARPSAALTRPAVEPGSDAALQQLLQITSVASRPSPSPPAATASQEHHAPSIYQLRSSPQRSQVTQMQGGSAETEAAVAAALRWLARNQSPDGRWDASQFGAGREARILGQDRKGTGVDADTGITGLALLAFLGAGHTHLEGEHSKTVRTGLEYLMREQAADGNLGGGADGFAFMYCHGMASLAMSEALAMSGDQRLKYAVTRAVAYTLAGQNRTTGGWRYRPNESGDTSQLGWQLMVLKSAELAGVRIPAEAKHRARQFLESVSSGESGGLASYRPHEPPTRTMTAEALWCKQFLGIEKDHPACREAADFVLGELPGASQTNLYYWYYATLAMYQLQGRDWSVWNAAITKTLTGSQFRDGPLAGSWDPDPVWGNYGGRVYSTALGALCLEVYYRFLPLHMGEAAANAASGSVPK